MGYYSNVGYWFLAAVNKDGILHNVSCGDVFFVSSGRFECGDKF